MVEVKDPADMAVASEPWFLTFNAEAQFRIAMTPKVPRRVDLSTLGRSSPKF
jgi:hypothetical protein